MKASSYPLQNIHTDKSEPYETKINDDSDSSAFHKSRKNTKLFNHSFVWIEMKKAESKIKEAKIRALSD